MRFTLTACLAVGRHRGAPAQGRRATPRARGPAAWSLLAACSIAAAGCDPRAAAHAAPAPADAASDAAPGFATPDQVFSKRSHAGLSVHLQRMRIQGKAGRTLWIANAAGRRVFVTPPDPSHLETLAVGARIDIRGELRSAPAARQAALLFGVDARTARRIAASPHYIDAWSITPPT